jgi:hypothetical protein
MSRAACVCLVFSVACVGPSEPLRNDASDGPVPDASDDRDAGPKGACELPTGSVNVLMPRADSLNTWTLLAPRFESGCASYVVDLSIVLFAGTGIGAVGAKYYVCNECREDMSLDYLVWGEPSVLEADPSSGADFELRGGPVLAVGVVDGQGRVVPNDCRWPDDELSCNDANLVPPQRARIVLPSGMVVTWDLIHVGTRSDMFPLFFDWRNDWRALVGQSAVEMFDYRGDIRIFFDLPRVYPSSTSTTSIRPEESEHLSCYFGGFPTPVECGYWLDVTEWSESDLIRYVTPPVNMPAELLDILRDRANQQ